MTEYVDCHDNTSTLQSYFQPISFTYKRFICSYYVFLYHVTRISVLEKRWRAYIYRKEQKKKMATMKKIYGYFSSHNLSNVEKKRAHMVFKQLVKTRNTPNNLNSIDFYVIAGYGTIYFDSQLIHRKYNPLGVKWGKMNQKIKNTTTVFLQSIT